MSVPLRNGDIIQMSDEMYCYDMDAWMPFAAVAMSYVGCKFDSSQMTVPTRRKTADTVEGANLHPPTNKVRRKAKYRP